LCYIGVFFEAVMMESERADAPLLGRDANPTTSCSSVSQKKSAHPLSPIHSFLSLLSRSFLSIRSYRSYRLASCQARHAATSESHATLDCQPYQARCAAALSQSRSRYLPTVSCDRCLSFHVVQPPPARRLQVSSGCWYLLTPHLF
jgi:hypothetical protein